jgi:transposase
VLIMPPAYVKPYVKRNKTDAADAEAICEAAGRPTMRFVPIKSAEQQGAGMVLKTGELLIRQRTQTANALRGHMAELGVVAAMGMASIDKLIMVIRDSIDPWGWPDHCGNREDGGDRSSRLSDRA